MCLKRRAMLIIQELELKTGDRILDIGCGDGFYLYLLRQLGQFPLTGIDNNTESLQAAKREVRDSSVKLVYGDILRLPFRTASFDKLVCSEVLEHLVDDVKGLLEMKRVLKQGGVLCITVPNYSFPFFWDPINYALQRFFHTHVRSGFWAGVWNMHTRLYTLDRLRQIVEKVGLQIERIECVTHYGLPFNHYLTNIGFRLRTSNHLSSGVRVSMSKFHPSSKKTWFSYILSFINWLDRRNDRAFSPQVNTVGIFLKARKI